MYRRVMSRRLDGRELEVFLVHPGGPFWAKRDLGAWSIPKGEYGAGEEALAAAEREFLEETGKRAEGPFRLLGAVKQAGGKVVTAWAFAGKFEASLLKSNTCTVEWPPRSGREIEIPEVDRGEWFSVEEARGRILTAQLPLLDRLVESMGLEGAALPSQLQ